VQGRSKKGCFLVLVDHMLTRNALEFKSSSLRGEMRTTAADFAFVNG